METNYTSDQMQKDMRELKIENRIQTVAVLLVFLFGIVTIHDAINKLK